VSTILNDVRIAIRTLAKAPGFTTVVVLTLAVAIGANTAIFSVVEGVLLRPLAYPDEGRIVRVAATVFPEAGGDGDAPFSDRGYWHFVNNNRAFEKFGGYSGQVAQIPLTGDGPPVQVDVSLMTLSAFEVLGVAPERGRLPTAAEDAPNGPRVALISRGLWSSRYGSDPAILGRTIQLNGAPIEIIGIMPDDYDFPTSDVDVWVPRRLDPASENFGGHHIEGIARLAPGVTLSAAVADARSLVARFSEVGYGPTWFQGIFDGGAVVVPLREEIVGDARQPLLIVLGTVGFVLLIACSNIANLLLVRAEGRRQENAVRLALGSSRLRIAGQTLTESALLAIAGGAAGVLLAYAGIRTLVALAPASIPRLDDIGINGAALAFTFAVTVVAGLLFGLLPALRSGGTGVLAALRDGGRGATFGRDRHRTRNALVMAQVALAFILVIGSGLMVRSFQELRSVDPGFTADGLLTFGVRPIPSKYANAEGVARFYDRLRERLAAVPGVTQVGAINTLPLTGGGAILTTVIDEFPPAEDEFPPVFLVRRVTPGYFEAMGVPVVEGRTFTPDDHNARLGSLIISNSVKAQYWPAGSALGKRITVAGTPARVVGVVGDVHDTGLDVEAEQFMYLPMLDSAGGGVGAMTMVARTGVEPLSVVPAIRSAIAELDPDMPIAEVRSMRGVLGDSLSRTSFTMLLLVLAAAVALFLGSVGIYGVLSYIVSQRGTEIGVRLALGASPGKVLSMVLSHGLRLAGIGVVTGILATAAMGRLIVALLFGISPFDPATLAAATLVFLVVAMLASLVPATRAAATAPADALRGR
jgi:predicted permease